MTYDECMRNFIILALTTLSGPLHAEVIDKCGAFVTTLEDIGSLSFKLLSPSAAMEKLAFFLLIYGGFFLLMTLVMKRLRVKKLSYASLIISILALIYPLMDFADPVCGLQAIISELNGTLAAIEIAFHVLLITVPLIFFFYQRRVLGKP